MIADPSPVASSPPSFYASALPLAMRDRYRQALATHGLGGEIALLRLRLYAMLSAEAANTLPPDAHATGQILRLIDLLIKALRAPAAHGGEDQLALERLLDRESLRVLALQK